MKKLLLFLSALFTITSSFSQEKEEFDWDKPMLGKKAPALQVKEWLTEKPDTTGKFIILDFWSTGCGPCVKFTPHMNEFAKIFKKEAVFIAIALQSKASLEKGVKQIEKIKKELAEEKVNNYLQDMRNIGISYKEAVEYLQELGGRK